LGGTIGENFGISISGAGDFNADGFDDLIVGADGSSLTGFTLGYAAAFSGAEGSLLHRWYSTSRFNNAFGKSVAGAGDINADGRADVLVGAPNARKTIIFAPGAVHVFVFNPILTQDTATLSATAGGVVHFDLNFPSAAAFQDYKILMSATGTAATQLGVTIPLQLDHFTVASFYNHYPVASTTNMHGTLNAHGNATASFTVPAGFAASVVGRSYYFVALTHQANELPNYSSVALSLESRRRLGRPLRALTGA
jgi:hypothetical protein